MFANILILSDTVISSQIEVYATGVFTPNEWCFWYLINTVKDNMNEKNNNALTSTAV